MRTNRAFILVEAAAMIPLVRSILVEVRELRCRLSITNRRIAAGEMTDRRGQSLKRLRDQQRRRIADCVAEADRLGVTITGGVRCEALFPFFHRWVGPQGDGRLRQAMFVYQDSQDSIVEWYFDGWPGDRRQVNPSWWEQTRPEKKVDRSNSTH